VSFHLSGFPLYLPRCRALEESKCNVSGAARRLGMERTNLHKRIRALGLSREK
jgi:transcriptional regulator of acetoin/glycerol metabolism